MENDNRLLTWSIRFIIPDDAIFSKNLWSVIHCLVFSTGYDWFRLVIQMTYCLLIAKKKWYVALGYQF